MVFCACSNDDTSQKCYVTEVTMTVNGEHQSFQALGRGIDLRSWGYELGIWLDRRSFTPLREQSISIKLPYKRLGKNIIQSFVYNQYVDNVPFIGDFLLGDFESQVFSNNSKCFYATFSGKFSDGNQEIEITNGVLKYTYEESFDN